MSEAPDAPATTISTVGLSRAALVAIALAAGGCSTVALYGIPADAFQQGDTGQQGDAGTTQDTGNGEDITAVPPYGIPPDDAH